MAVRIQFRRGTTSQWNEVNPILASGEVGFNTTLNQFKVGTGDDRWSDLPYYSVGTITEVIAGAGLSGGGSSGSVTLSLGSSVLTTDYVSAKGDLITATADNSPTLLPVGSTDGDVLQVASSEVTGLTYGKVQTSAIANSAVTEAKIQDTAVTASKIATNAITSTKIQVNAVTGDKIADGSVTESKIDTAAVTVNKLANNAVTTTKIADLAVTGAKFADNSITSAKIANNTIVNEDINEFANIGLAKLSTGALPTAITVTTDNYTNNSVTAGKLSNTAGSTGVGVWQDWTPIVYPSGGSPAFSNSQFVSLYSKYMIINNYCTAWMIIQIVNRSTNTSTPVLRFSLPIEPSFSSCVPAGTHVNVGTIYRNNVTDPGRSDVLSLVYHVARINATTGQLEVREFSKGASDTTSFSSLRTGDVISFKITYEVNSVYTPVPGSV